MIEYANFYVSARIALQLGRESISSSLTAIVELVKNAYDADAKEVRLSFHDYRGGFPSTLVIEDDGHGMDRSDVVDRWMFIGDSAKGMQRLTSGRGRVLTGEKGLGRLGLDRLCARTIVQSQKISSAGVELDINWTGYEGTAVALEKVRHPIKSISGFDRISKCDLLGKESVGTRLVLRDLKDEWSQDLLSSLESELSLLLSPVGDVADFSVSIYSGVSGGGVDPVSVLPSAEILHAAAWRVEACIAKDGAVSMKMDTCLHDKAYEIPAATWGSKFKGVGDVPLCGPLRMVFHFIPRERVKVSRRGLDIDVSRSRIASFMNSNQGVRIYRDGFRVKPYGDPHGEGDWLRLAARRVKNPQGVKQSKWSVGPNQITGAVFITRSENPGLADQANREGIMEGRAMSHLRTFALSVIEWFEANNQSYQKGMVVPSDSVDSMAMDALAATKDATSKLRVLHRDIDKVLRPGSIVSDKDIELVRGMLSDATGQVSKSEVQVRRTAEGARDVLMEAERQKDMLGNLASLGILSASFGHETLNSSENILKAAGYFNSDLFPALGAAGLDLKTPSRWLKVMMEDSVRVERFARFALGNVMRNKRRRTVFSVSNVVKYVFDSFENSLVADRSIKIDLRLVDGRRDLISAYEGDWECVFVNLITNSVWAMMRTPGKDRRISVDVSMDHSSCSVTFADSGFGLEEGTESLIFQPTFTTRRNDRGEATGTGLGLSLVKGFVVDNSMGSVSAIKSGSLGGAEFYIRVPLVKGGV